MWPILSISQVANSKLEVQRTCGDMHGDAKDGFFCRFQALAGEPRCIAPVLAIRAGCGYNDSRGEVMLAPAGK